jgi:hypothetical protein
MKQIELEKEYYLMVGNLYVANVSARLVSFDACRSKAMKFEHWALDCSDSERVAEEIANASKWLRKHGFEAKIVMVKKTVEVEEAEVSIHMKHDGYTLKLDVTK